MKQGPHKDSIWNVISGFDDNYLWPWLVSTYSGCVTSNLLPRRVISTTKNGISEQNWNLINQFSNWLGFETDFLEITLPENLPVSDHFTPIVYSRLSASELLEENFIWMDVDTLLFANWDLLLSLPAIPTGFVSRAVPEPLSILHSDKNNDAIRKAGNRYFNAGVLQIDPIAFREHGFDDQWKTLIGEYTTRNFRYADQCVLNFMLVDFNLPLDQEFNYIPAFWNTEENPNFPKVIHYAGTRKPWKIPNLERNRLFNLLRVHKSDTYFFSKYWEMEKKMLKSARKFSTEFAQKLEKLQETNIDAMDISLSRIYDRFR